MLAPEAARATPRSAVGGPLNAAKLGRSQRFANTTPKAEQDDGTASTLADALDCGRIEAIAERAALAAASIAAFRGDKSQPPRLIAGDGP